jgi:hypothetical protein
MLRRFFVFLVAFSSLSAWAECRQYQVIWRGQAGSWSSSKEAACSSINGKSVNFDSILISITVSGARIDEHGNCAYKESSLYVNSNGPNVVDSSSGFETRVVASCESPCTELMGQDFTLNWSLGYTRTPDIDADLNWKFVAPPVKPPSNGLVCDPVSSCKVALVLAPTAVWQSLSPTSQGLYRVSVDYDAQHMGESCTPTDADKAGAHPAADKPTCPGFVGEVNGVTGCYGTASNPTANDVPESKPKPPEAGNPSAGKKPDSGEGSGTGGAGRTPSTGDGGPAGGPAAAAGSGTKPDGTTPKPDEGKEQANCGAPGQPKCGIDESGTPTKFDGKGDLLGGWEEGVKANRATIEKSGTGIFDSFSVFFSAPPLAGCEPIELPNDQVITRHCDVVDGTRSVMAYIWALTALWLCVGWIREAI